jgi:fructokinase
LEYHGILFTLVKELQTPMRKIFCFGEALIDFVAEKQGNDLSRATIFTKKAGGAPANVACAIAKLGGRSSFVGCVGNDPFGKYLLNVLKSCGVDISLAQHSDIFTSMAFVSLAEDGERDFVFSRGADRELLYKPSLKAQFPGNMVHLGAATALLGGGLEKAYGHYFFDALTEGAFICFDPNFRQDLWKKKEALFVRKCHPFIEKANLCKFSLEEARLLSGKQSLEDACAEIHRIGARVITVTLGSDGTFLSTGDGNHTVESINIKAVDTTGAGDAFIGCLLYQLSSVRELDAISGQLNSLIEMVALANKAGAITAMNYGAIESLPGMEQLQATI